MRALETDWWMMEMPPEWEATQDEDTVVIEDEDGVSCIEITTLVKQQGAVTDAEILDFAADTQQAAGTLKSVEVGDWRGVYAAYQDDDVWVREWYLRDAGQCLLVAHSSALDNQGMDDAAVDEMLSTIVRRIAD